MAEVREECANKPVEAWNEGQRAAIAQELDRVLSHPAFKSSNRCVELLNCLVQHALAGDVEGLKERTLGVETFGRLAAYDTNADPIVRRTANEIRKRLAQCYQESSATGAVKIHLVRGSYLPEFEFAGEAEPPASADATFAPLRQQHGPAKPARARLLGRGWLRWGAGAALLVLIAASLCIYWMRSERPNQLTIWQPLLESGSRLTICLSDNTPLESITGDSGVQRIRRLVETLHEPPAPMSDNYPAGTAFMDARSAHAVASWLWQQKKQTHLQPSSALKLADFRQGPTVLVGGTNNPWVLSLLSDLRYSVRIDAATNDKWIQDAMDPSARPWKIDGKLRFTDTTVDYAVITRYFDKETGEWIMALCGLEAYATEAASELLTNPSMAKELPSSLSSKGNFQMVIQTTVINGGLGQLRILAVHNW